MAVNLTQKSKTDANGRINEVDIYSGTTLTEIDSYTYLANGQLSSVSKRNAQGVLIESDTYYNGKILSISKYDISGKIIESCSYNNSQLSSVAKYNSAGKITEYDYYTNGVLTQVMNTNTQGALVTLDNYKYVNGQLNTITKTNSKGVIVEIDKISNSTIEIDSYVNGLISQASFKNTQGNITETDLYSYNGKLLTSIAKTNTQGETFEIDTYGLNTSLANYGYFIKQSDLYTKGLKVQTVLNDNFGKKIETDFFQYTDGKVSAIDRYNAQDVIFESDKYLAGTLVEVDKYLGDKTEYDRYVNGILSSAVVKNSQGMVIENDTYQYNSGSLSSITKTNIAGQIIGLDTYTYSNGNVSVISKQFSNGVLSQQTNYLNGQISSTTKYTDGKLIELDVYTSGSLFSVTKFNGGQITEMDKYSSGAVSEIDQYFYKNGKLATVVKTDPFGKIIATDTYYGSAYIENYPDTTINGQWSSHFGYGTADALKALSAVLGTPISDQPVPTYIASQWDLNSMHFDDLWAYGYTGKGIVIADIDTGIDLKNTALTQHLSAYNWNFVDNNNNVQDKNGHGTATASEMIASNTGSAVTGGAYDATLMVLKAMNDNGTGSAANISAAIRYAVDHGANVINLSLGGPLPSTLEQQALAYADAHGVAVIVAAGNAGTDDPQYPAIYAKNFQSVIAVGATTNTTNGLALSYFSNEAGSTTPFNFIDAPGSNITLYGLNSKVTQMSGTSMASPLVAAEIADLLSAHTNLSVQQIVTDVVHTASLSLIGVASNGMPLALA